MSAAARALVVAEARSWIGTPYHHHARIKGAGVDCAQILVAVFHAAGLVPALELGNYAPQWHLHHREELYLQQLQAAGAHQLAPGQLPQPGDVGVWHWGRTYSHGGIVVEGGADPLVVHAYIGHGVTVSRASEAPLAGHAHLYWSVMP